MRSGLLCGNTENVRALGVSLVGVPQTVQQRPPAVRLFCGHSTDDRSTLFFGEGPCLRHTRCLVVRVHPSSLSR